MTSEGNYITHLEKCLHQTFLTIKKKKLQWKEFILWGQHHPDTQSKQKQHRKRKVQASVTDGHTCRYSQLNINKLNPTRYSKDHTPWSRMICPKNARIHHHINKLKSKNHIVITVDVKNASENIQHWFMIKTLQKMNLKRIIEHNIGYI